MLSSNNALDLTVKPSQAYPPRFYQGLDHLKNESVSRSRNWCQIQSGISACIMSSEYFTRTSLYLVRLEIFEWIKLLRRHLHQFQENGAGRNFITASRVNSRLITHTRMQRSIWNLQLATDSWGVCLTWFDCNTVFISLTYKLNLQIICDSIISIRVYHKTSHLLKVFSYKFE